MKKVLALVAMAAALASGAASAAPQIFFGEDAGLGGDTPLGAFPNADTARDQFLAAIAGKSVATETFESYAPSTDYMLGALVIDLGTLGTATLNGGYVTNEPYGGRYAIAGSQYWDTSSDSFTVTFSNAVTGFGFYGIDIGDFSGRITITLSDGTLYDVNHASNAPSGSVLYWGFYDADTPFTSITFGNTNAGADWFGFDNLTVAAASTNTVPEPAMLGLLGLGVVALRLGRQRSKAA